MSMSSFKNVRTRFAPSPTGELHIGGVRTALFGYLFSRQHSGEWLLRIEDTDQQRFKQGSTESILEGLKWLGLQWDGEVVVQSQRIQRYQEAAGQLLKAGFAYRCFCTAQRLEQMRLQQTEQHQAPKYDRRCLGLSDDEIQKKIQASDPFVLRMKIPDAGETVFNDLIRGEIRFKHADLDDQVLLKSDGFPTYHLANVVDDHDSEISHVIRAEEWLPSTPKHLLLYEFFKWPAPQFAHLPLILNSNRSKMSKRKDGEWVWLSTYRKLGYLPEAIVNYLALLGWNPKTEQEIFSLQELSALFKLEQVHRAGAVFSKDRLDQMNAEYIRAFPLVELVRRARPFFDEAGIEGRESESFLQNVVQLEQARIKILSELPSLTHYFFKDHLDFSPEALVWKKSNPEQTKSHLKALQNVLASEQEGEWDAKSLEQRLLKWIEAEGWDRGSVLWPMRMALTGEQHSPGPFEVAAVLGKAKTLQRLHVAEKML